MCTRSLLANPVTFELLDPATFLTVNQIAYLSSFKAHKLAREHQHRQSLSGKKIKGIALSRKAICMLILLVGIVGVLGVIMPMITRILVGNEATATKIARYRTVQCCAIIQKDVDHSSLSSLWISPDRTKEGYIQDSQVLDELFLLLLLF